MSRRGRACVRCVAGSGRRAAEFGPDYTPANDGCVRRRLRYAPARYAGVPDTSWHL